VEKKLICQFSEYLGIQLVLRKFEMEAKFIIAFGPVPSRRLGRSLGINNVPAKNCTYSCIYCQLGNTAKTEIEPRSFYKLESIFHEVDRIVKEANKRREKIDYLTFVPDGEPTLDKALGEEISLLRKLRIKIAVITNASLTHRAEVREALSKADLVSLKLDSVSEDIWRMINRPSKSLNLRDILDGMQKFAKEFKGNLITETMLVDGVNDKEDEIKRIAEFLARIKPVKAYVAIPTRPPAEGWVKPARESIINMAYQKFEEKLGKDRVEYLISYEGDEFILTGNIVDDLLSITSVHPMRKEAVEKLLKKANTDWSVLNELIKKSKLVELEYGGHKFYMRRIPSRF
jgi:wyosine [tRNA(Phe)-imidazoG37] synthetase (radical SAM superfamily)